MIKNKKVFYTEENARDGSVNFLFENEEPSSLLNTVFEFVLSGYELEGTDEDSTCTWTISLPPGSSILKKMKVAPKK